MPVSRPGWRQTFRAGRYEMLARFCCPVLAMHGDHDKFGSDAHPAGLQQWPVVHPLQPASRTGPTSLIANSRSGVRKRHRRSGVIRPLEGGMHWESRASLTGRTKPRKAAGQHPPSAAQRRSQHLLVFGCCQALARSTEPREGEPWKQASKRYSPSAAPTV